MSSVTLPITCEAITLAEQTFVCQLTDFVTVIRFLQNNIRKTSHILIPVSELIMSCKLITKIHESEASRDQSRVLPVSTQKCA